MGTIADIAGPTLFEAPYETARLASMQPGQRLARGVVRHLRTLGYACLEEFRPDRGLRVDVMAMGPRGDLWVVECKSCRADFQADRKWTNYLPHCDRFFWAVDASFPVELLPEDTGLMVGDAYDAAIVREAPEDKLSAPRRTKLTRAFARCAAERWMSAADPRV